jgi:hypothetical protein
VPVTSFGTTGGFQDIRSTIYHFSSIKIIDDVIDSLQKFPTGLRYIACLLIYTGTRDLGLPRPSAAVYPTSH